VRGYPYLHSSTYEKGQRDDVLTSVDESLRPVARIQSPEPFAVLPPPVSQPLPATIRENPRLLIDSLYGRVRTLLRYFLRRDGI
jgi:hypothetical protein